MATNSKFEGQNNNSSFTEISYETVFKGKKALMCLFFPFFINTLFEFGKKCKIQKYKNLDKKNSQAIYTE